MASSPEPRAAARILCAGIAVVDHVYRLERFPAPGSKTRAQAFVATGGGCAANAALAVARLGGHARLSAPLGGPQGEDAIGDSILARLDGESVDHSGVVRVAGATSPISTILIDATGERLIVNHRDEALNDARPRDPDTLVADADAVLVDNRFAPFVLPLAQAARRKGIPVVLDVDRPAPLDDDLRVAASHLVFSADGLRANADAGTLASALAEFDARVGAFVAVTDGANGMIWRDAGIVRAMPAFAVAAVDTLGAGDVFHGAFALALAEGRNIQSAMRFAAAAAAIKCTRFGGAAGAPSRAEVEAFLASA